MESNHRPAVYETAALPTELRRPGVVRRNITQTVKHLSMSERRCRGSRSGNIRMGFELSGSTMDIGHETLWRRRETKLSEWRGSTGVRNA